MDIKEIIEKYVQNWYNENTDKRCVVIIAMEDQDEKEVLSMALLGKEGNLTEDSTSNKY